MQAELFKEGSGSLELYKKALSDYGRARNMKHLAIGYEYVRTLTKVVKADSGIKTLADLAGKNILRLMRIPMMRYAKLPI